MKLNSIPSSHEIRANVKAFFHFRSDTVVPAPEEPLRDELFGSEQLERFAKALAGKPALSEKPAKDHLLRRLADNETLLQEVRKLLIKPSRTCTSANCGPCPLRSVWP